MKKEVYIGDGVYASLDNGMIKLRAPRGHDDHIIWLEPEVYSALTKFVENIKQEHEAIERGG